MEDITTEKTPGVELFQIDLAEAFRKQVNYQIKILKSAITKLQALEELPVMPVQKPN